MISSIQFEYTEWGNLHKTSLGLPQILKNSLKTCLQLQGALTIHKDRFYKKKSLQNFAHVQARWLGC